MSSPSAKHGLKGRPKANREGTAAGKHTTPPALQTGESSGETLPAMSASTTPDAKKPRAKKTLAKPKKVVIRRPPRPARGPPQNYNIRAMLQNSPTIVERPASSLPLMSESTPLLEHPTSPKPVIATDKNGNLQFSEPALAVPKPGITGTTLESMPPQKAKKVPSGLGRCRKPKPSANRAASEEITDHEFMEREQRYNRGLETPRLEKMTTLSGLRREVEPTKPKHATSRGKYKTKVKAEPTTPRVTKRGLDGSPRSSKRLKIISPKKTGFLLRPPSPKPEESDANENDEFCTTCGGSGVFICCDSCPKSFHLLCCDPPLREVPEDNWNCHECSANYGPPRTTNDSDIGMFGPLLNAKYGQNPTVFRLPKRLRDGTFLEVFTGDDQNYTDTLAKPDPPAKQNGQLVGFNKDDDLNIEGIYDKSGRPHLCHKCGLSALNRRTIVVCDYCPLKWHLDCLPEPVCLPKTLGQKWRCPNHVESLLPSFWTERRAFKDTLVLDAAMQTSFLRLLLANNFIIQHKGQPYLSSENPPQLQDYTAYERREFLKPDSDFVSRVDEKVPEPELDDDEGLGYSVPDFFQNYAVNDAVVSRAGKKLSRVLLMTNADDEEQQPFVYRVPEEQILLDFILKGRKSEILQNLDAYRQKAVAEQNTELEAVNTLLDLHAQPVVLSAVSEELAELEELRKIKKLIEIRGKDALMDFLRS